MTEWPRLKWRKAERGYRAYPVGRGRASGERYAEVFLQASGVNTDATPHKRWESWCWVVRWDGWFVHHGFETEKQSAANKATEQWWMSVQTELPRNLELEVAMIVARVLVRPPPNSLLGEDSEFLRKVLWQLNELYRAELKREAPPTPVKELMARLSEELHRRRGDGRPLT